MVSGRAGGIPCFVDEDVGCWGPHPLVGMSAGFNKFKENEPCIVD